VGYTSDLVLGLAELLALEGIGVVREDTPYQPGETAIVQRSMPDAPDRAICLTPYPVDDDVTTDPNDTLDLGDAILALLHNRRGYWLRSVRVAESWRVSEVLLGTDAHGRDERTSNFYFQTTRALPNSYE
jgi:hypothetical protein